MRAAIAEKPFVTPTGEKIPIHASFGIATFPDDGQGVNELVVAADCQPLRVQAPRRQRHHRRRSRRCV